MHAEFPHTPLVRLVPTGKRSCCSFCAHLQMGLEEMPKQKTMAPRSDPSPLLLEHSSTCEGPVGANGVRRHWLRFRRAEWRFDYCCYFKVKLRLLGASQFYGAHFIFPTFIWIICPLLAIKKKKRHSHIPTSSQVAVYINVTLSWWVQRWTCLFAEFLQNL